MEPYSVSLKPSVEKDLRRLPDTLANRMLTRIAQLSIDPTPRHARKLTGSERLYRIRVGDYRIVYEVDAQQRSVIIHYVRHRREAYRGL